jgi:hypothetical protein
MRTRRQGRRQSSLACQSPQVHCFAGVPSQQVRHRSNKGAFSPFDSCWHFFVSRKALSKRLAALATIPGQTIRTFRACSPHRPIVEINRCLLRTLMRSPARLRIHLGCSAAGAPVPTWRHCSYTKDFSAECNFSADSNTSGLIADALYPVFVAPEVSVSVTVRRRFPLHVPRTRIRELQ